MGCYHPLFAGRFLWPYCDRIVGASFDFSGHRYVLPVNDPETGDAIHGFLYKTPVTVLKHEETESETLVELHVAVAANVRNGYPFACELYITLQLLPSALIITMRSRNTGRTSCPVSFGWHPYFRLPGMDTVNDLILRTNADSYVPVDTSLKPLGTLRDVTSTDFDYRESATAQPRTLSDKELDIALTCRDSHEVQTVIEHEKYLLQLQQRGAFRFQQLFVPPSRAGIAIEPITAPANAFNEPNLGLTVLQPGQELSGQFEVRLLSN